MKTPEPGWADTILTFLLLAVARFWPFIIVGGLTLALMSYVERY